MREYPEFSIGGDRAEPCEFRLLPEFEGIAGHGTRRADDSSD